MLSSYIAGRLVATIPVLFGISVLVFTLLRLTPGDPAIMIAGPQASAAELELVRKSLGLDQPIPLQFVSGSRTRCRATWDGRASSSVPVAPLVLDRFRNTLILALASLGLAVTIAIPAGHHLGAQTASPGRPRHHDLDAAGELHAAVLDGADAHHRVRLDAALVPDGRHERCVESRRRYRMCCLAPGPADDHPRLPATALIARMMRSSMLDVLKLDHLRTARAKGLMERVVLERHAVKLALLPVLTVVGIRFGYLLGGAAITETVFNWPGVGLQLFKAIGSRDYAFIQGAVLLIATIFVAGQSGHRLAVCLCRSADSVPLVMVTARPLQ